MINRKMSTSEKRREMENDMREVQMYVSQRIAGEDYKGKMKEATAFPWFPNDPYLCITSTGNQWVAAGRLLRQEDIDSFAANSLLYACLMDDGTDGKDAYLNLPYNGWDGVEMLMFTAHSCDGLRAEIGGMAEKNSVNRIYYLLERNFIFANVGYMDAKRKKGRARQGEKIFFTSIEAMGFGEIDKDGKLAVIDRVVSHEQVFGDQELISFWKMLASQSLQLENKGYCRKGRIWQIMGDMTEKTLKLCHFMEIIAKMDEEKREHPDYAMINPGMKILNDSLAIKTHNETDRHVANNLGLLEWGINNLPLDLRAEIMVYMKKNPQNPGQTAYKNLMHTEGILEEMEKSFRKAFEEVRTATMNTNLFKAV